VKVFLDTNVLVSAVATRGLCADVLREVLTSHELVISDSLLKELKRVLQQKLRLPSPLISGYIDLLQQDTIFAKPVNLPDVTIKDKDDLIILASALSANSDLLVTGDRELLALGKVRNLEIVSPREFWEKLKNAGAEGRRGRGKEIQGRRGEGTRNTGAKGRKIRVGGSEELETEGRRMGEGFRSLKVWQKAYEFALGIYRVTKMFPREELYGLTNQMRRAALSISANIAEGYERQHRKEYIQFLMIAHGSLGETETFLLFAKDLGYIDEKVYGALAGC